MLTPRARAPSCQWPWEAERVAHDVVEAHRARPRHLARARELLQPPHDLRPVLGRLLDDGERAPQALVFHAALQELHASHHDGQEVVEMVGGAPRQLAERAQSLALHELLLHGLEIVERLLRLVVEARVAERDAREIGERGEVVDLGRRVAPRRRGVEGQHADDALAEADGQAQERDDALVPVVLGERILRIARGLGRVHDLAGGRHAPGVAGADRHRESRRQGRAAARPQPQRAPRGIEDQHLHVRGAGDAGGLADDLLEGGPRVEAAHDRARRAQQRAQLLGAAHGRGMDARPIQRESRGLREPGEHPHLALRVGVRLVPRHRDHADQRVLGHERHGQDRAHALLAHGVAQELAVGEPVAGVAGRLVLAPVRREERRTAQRGGAHRALAGPEGQQRLHADAPGHAGYELLRGVELEHAAAVGADERARGVGDDLQHGGQVERGGEGGRHVVERGQLARVGLGLADEARVLGGQRDLSGDGRGHLDGLGRPLAVLAAHEPQPADGVVLAADRHHQLHGGGAGGQAPRPRRLAELDVAALGPERGGGAVRDLVERGGEVGGGRERLRDGQQHVRALGVLALLGEARGGVDGRPACRREIACAGEVARRERAAPAERGEQADPDAARHERDRDHGADRFLGEPRAPLGRRGRDVRERGRPAGRQPVREAARGPVSQRSGRARTGHAERGVERELAAVTAEQPERHGVRWQPRLRVGRETVRDEVEIEDVGGHLAPRL
jgi:hypothetical protein